MYQTNDFGKVYAGNPLNSGKPSCPSGFNSYHMERSLHPEDKVGNNLYICLPPFQEYKSEIGGFYQISDMQQSVDNIDNSFTGGRSCPQEYKAVQFGRIKAPEGRQVRVNVFICL
jgi:hypothetical protein